jgi:hypothetical protein
MGAKLDCYDERLSAVPSGFHLVLLTLERYSQRLGSVGIVLNNENPARSGTGSRREFTV